MVREIQDFLFSARKRPDPVQANFPFKDIRPVCGGGDHTADRCGTDGKALAVSASKSFGDEEEMDLAGMMTVGGASGDSAKVTENCFKSMSESGSRACNALVGCPSTSHVGCALLADDADDVHDPDPSKWRRYSSKRCGPSFTWYGDSGATRYILRLNRVRTRISLPRV